MPGPGGSPQPKRLRLEETLRSRSSNALLGQGCRPREQAAREGNAEGRAVSTRKRPVLSEGERGRWEPRGSRLRDGGLGLRWVTLLKVSSRILDRFRSSLFCPYRNHWCPERGSDSRGAAAADCAGLPRHKRKRFSARDQPQGALVRCFSRSNKHRGSAGTAEAPPEQGPCQAPQSSVERTTALPGQRALPGARQAPQQHQRFAEAPRGAAGRGLQAEPPQSAEQLLLHTARLGAARHGTGPGHEGGGGRWWGAARPLSITTPCIAAGLGGADGKLRERRGAEGGG